MIGILIISHGTLGESLIHCASHMLNKRPPRLRQIGVTAQDDPLQLVPQARKMIKDLDEGDGVLVLTDIFGATPGNVVSRVLEDGRIEGVSGVSLPMLLRVLTSRNGASKDALGAAVQRALSGGAEGVVHMNQDRCLDA